MTTTEIKQLNAELKAASEEQLLAKRLQFKKEMVNLGHQQASAQLENPNRITFVRKAIARIETALSVKRNAVDAK